MPKPCPECGYESPPKGEKFCKMCRGKVLRKMKRNGYFTRVPRRPKDRPLDAQEDREETIYGIDDRTLDSPVI